MLMKTREIIRGLFGSFTARGSGNIDLSNGIS